MTETPTAAEEWQTITDVNMSRGDFEKLMADVRRQRDELEHLRRGANIAVAAELRRIADEQAARGRGVSDDHNFVSVATIRSRADELDPPARQDD